MKTTLCSTLATPPTAAKLPVFTYDAAGHPLGQYPTAGACARALKLTRECVYSGLRRGSIVQARYYLSHKATFRAADQPGAESAGSPDPAPAGPAPARGLFRARIFRR